MKKFRWSGGHNFFEVINHSIFHIFVNLSVLVPYYHTSHKIHCASYMMMMIMMMILIMMTIMIMMMRMNINNNIQGKPCLCDGMPK